MNTATILVLFFFSRRRRHTRLVSDWSSDVCSSDLEALRRGVARAVVASVGPVCSEALEAHGIAPDLEASPPKMGPLVALVAARARDLVAAKRGARLPWGDGRPQTSRLRRSRTALLGGLAARTSAPHGERVGGGDPSDGGGRARELAGARDARPRAWSAR